MDMPSFPKQPGHGALRKGRHSLPGYAYHVTVTTLDREDVFADFECARIASASFECGTILGDSTLLAWVLMPDHVHWLLQLGQQDSLGGLVSRMKSASARNVNHVRGRRGALWSRAFHDHAIRGGESLEQVAAYIIANPLRAKLATDIGNYPFWNSTWLL
jgi:REP element-mobilizing transposase RayT